MVETNHQHFYIYIIYVYRSFEVRLDFCIFNKHQCIMTFFTFHRLLFTCTFARGGGIAESGNPPPCVAPYDLCQFATLDVYPPPLSPLGYPPLPRHPLRIH